MTLHILSRWRRLHTTFSYVFDDVTVFRRESIHKFYRHIFNPRLIYNYFRLRKATVCHIGILLPVSLLTISPCAACRSALGCRISSKSGHPRRSNDVAYNFKMAAAPYYFRFSIYLMMSLRSED